MIERDRPATRVSGRRRAHLQPQDLDPADDRDHLDEGDPFDLLLPADERLDRMLGDEELLQRLQWSGYADAVWSPVAAEFARYGLGVISGWVRSGLIFTRVWEKTRNELRRPDGPFDDDAVNTLTTDTVVAALGTFLETVLKTNRWDPRRGASLKTFFIGQCCFRFSNAYRSWYRSQNRLRRVELVEPHRLQPTTAQPAVDHAVLTSAAAHDALKLLSTDVAKDVARLTAVGYSQSEIADQLGLQDEKAVENILGYQRRRLARAAAKQERAG